MNYLSFHSSIARFIACLLLICGSNSALEAQTLKQILLMPGELTASHKKYEPKCESCHLDFDRSSQNNLCTNCHKEISKDINSKVGLHGLNNTVAKAQCKDCHTDHKGREFNIVGLDRETFNHNETDFKLKGKHNSLLCINCHQPNREKQAFLIEKFQCIDCHQEESPHRDQVADKCDNCHENSTWNKISFDHSETDFLLKHAHRKTACRNCHIDEKYLELGKLCSNCHAINDIHQQRFGNKCEDCHNEKKWEETSFNHNDDTEFKLFSAHIKTPCESCHQEKNINQSSQPPKTCIDCHRKDDIHNQNLGEECESCHKADRWSTIRFDHNTDTDFILEGNHEKTSCNSCHNIAEKNEVEGRECIDCHRLTDPHQNTLGDHCEQCHNSRNWEKTLFSHDLVKFPLLGMHKNLACNECHIESDFSKTNQECNSCHQADDYHKEALGSECEQCHNPNDWSMWLFDHDEKTHYPLKGAHENLQCNLCHKDQLETSQQCNNCHNKDDPHRGSFGRQCQNCHNETSFKELQ